jgi:hypothetical protein
MVGFAIVTALALGYVVYRMGLTIRAIRAERAGDLDHAGDLRTRAAVLGVGVLCTLTLLFLLVVLVTEVG